MGPTAYVTLVERTADAQQEAEVKGLLCRDVDTARRMLLTLGADGEDPACAAEALSLLKRGMGSEVRDAHGETEGSSCCACCPA